MVSVHSVKGVDDSVVTAKPEERLEYMRGCQDGASNAGPTAEASLNELQEFKYRLREKELELQRTWESVRSSKILGFGWKLMRICWDSWNSYIRGTIRLVEAYQVPEVDLTLIYFRKFGGLRRMSSHKLCVCRNFRMRQVLWLCDPTIEPTYPSSHSTKL